jgi:hypothetical protein
MDAGTKANLVVVFRGETTDDQIMEFHRSVTGSPSQTGSGYRDLPGIMTAVRIQIQGHEAEAYVYKPDITQEQKALIETRIRASPIVQQTFTDVVPNSVELF